jgi:hypothetical protein
MDGNSVSVWATRCGKTGEMRANLESGTGPVQFDMTRGPSPPANPFPYRQGAGGNFSKKRIIEKVEHTRIEKQDLPTSHTIEEVSLRCSVCHALHG